MNWIEGRQGTGYFKLKIFSSKWLGVDCYLLKYETGSFIPPHTDPVEGFEHHRINIELKRAYGGHCYIIGRNKRWWRFTYFRPDIQEHWVSMISKGTRYVLSIGWVTE